MSKAKKDKVKKVSDAEAKKLVLDEMKKVNRPYNSQTISLNLHSAVSKTQAAKICTEYTNKGIFTEKVKGKQKIYFIAQEGLEALDPQGLAKLDEDQAAAKETLKELNQEIAVLQSEINGLNSALTTEQLDEEIQRLTENNKQLETKVESLTSEGAKVASADDKQKAVQNLERGRTEWKKRKRICTEIINDICEMADKEKKWLYKSADLETDEAVGVSIDGKVPEKPSKKPAKKKRKTST